MDTGKSMTYCNLIYCHDYYSLKYSVSHLNIKLKYTILFTLNLILIIMWHTFKNHYVGHNQEI